MADLAENAFRFQEKNTNVAVIGSGDPGHFSEFREKTGYQGLLFSDPSLEVFSFLGFSRGISGFLSVKSIFKAASAFKDGHRQGSIQGNTLQLGGAVVIDSAGTMRFFFAGKKAGDHADIDVLIRAVNDSTQI